MITCLAFLLKKICIGERRFLKLFLGILAAVFYLFTWVVFGIAGHPLGVFMSVLLPIIVIWLMVKNSSRVLKIIIVSIFICSGIYFTFHNNIPGPQTFLICDTIDVHSQWFDCYRFFWVGCILFYTIWLASFLSAIPIVVYKFITKT